MPDAKEIIRLTSEVSHLKGKVEEMDKNITEHFKEVQINISQLCLKLEKRITDVDCSVRNSIKGHEVRLNACEEKTAEMKGRAAGIAFVVSLIISVIGILIAFYEGFFHR